MITSTFLGNIMNRCHARVAPCRLRHMQLRSHWQPPFRDGLLVTDAFEQVAGAVMVAPLPGGSYARCHIAVAGVAPVAHCVQWPCSSDAGIAVAGQAGPVLPRGASTAAR